MNTKWMVDQDGELRCPSCWDKRLARLDKELRKIVEEGALPDNKCHVKGRDMCENCGMIRTGSSSKYPRLAI